MISKYITTVLLVSQTHSFIPKSPSFTKQTITNLQIDTNAVNYKYKAIESLSSSPINIDASIKSVVAPITDKLQSLPISDVSSIKESIVSILTDVQNKGLALDIESIKKYVFALDSNELLAIPLYSLLFFAVFSTIFNMIGKNDVPSKPYPNNSYDAISSSKYFDNNPIQVITRAIQVTALSATFGINLLLDYVSDKMKENEDQRGLELASLLTKLGPSFIKIGQSLSIRTDLLSGGYVRGLKTLQDQVPPFDTTAAYDIINRELGSSNLFKEISGEPIAAASLGQVYKATLQNGTDVAIKVQRPDIMNSIALDMYLIRSISPFLKRTFNLNTDLVGVVDTWGKGFVDELDYKSEAYNAIQFMESLQSTPLKNVVFAPIPLMEYCTDKVLTTEWIDGERLDVSTQQDVTVLCSVAMNTYLTMMLETGTLHCDPHPGNLLRTPDGRLCILDWGMVTKLQPDLQITLIEHMAHLTSADYEEIPNDLLLLGFIPESKKQYIEDSDIVETLAGIYGAWTQGGGAAAVNVNEVVNNLQGLAETRGNLFQIPPYFAYIAKSFSVLEGIGLQNDPKYSIVNECLPYVSKRLLTDNSERTGGALSTFIFGPDKNSNDRIIDYKRVEQLVNGFGSYTTSASGAALASQNSTPIETLEEAADQILELIITEDETPLQKIIIEQLAKIITASSKSIWQNVRKGTGTLPSGRSLLGSVIDPLGLWRTSPLVSMTDSDLQILQSTRKVIELLSTSEDSKSMNRDVLQNLNDLSNEEILELSSLLVQKIWNKRAGVLNTSRRLAFELIKVTADTLERGERAVVVEDHLDESIVAPSLSVTPGKSSVRLENARRVLADLENDVEIA